jgi:hypothetical protein
MTHSKPYVRKKAVLAMYKLFVAYPQGLRLTFDKLKDKLNDAEATVKKKERERERSRAFVWMGRVARCAKKVRG